MPKSASHICCMPISDHSGNHHMDKCSQHGMFFSVDCQLLLTCLQHRMIPFVLNPTQRVMSMIVNHLHQVFSKIYIHRSFVH